MNTQDRYTKAVKLIERLDLLSSRQVADIKLALEDKDEKRLTQLIKELELI